MQNDPWLLFADRVAYDDDLHADCIAADLPLDDLRLNALRERNLNVLGTLAAFGERRTELVDDESPLAQDLLRLDSKLNVMMAMLDQLLRRGADLPSRVLVQFNAVGALLPASLWPGKAPTAILRLHFDGCLALPLELPARLAMERDVDHVFVAFESLDDATCDALERLVFRHHRRKVAVRRQAAS